MARRLCYSHGHCAASGDSMLWPAVGWLCKGHHARPVSPPCNGQGSPCGCKNLGHGPEHREVTTLSGSCSAHLCCRCTPCFP